MASIERNLSIGHLPRVKRRVRIEGKLDDLAGYNLKIIDLDTGEEITNITKAEITLLPGECNTVKFTYLKENERGKAYMEQTGEVAIGEVVINSPDLSFTANEFSETEFWE
jgi:hypothetical protein